MTLPYPVWALIPEGVMSWEFPYNLVKNLTDRQDITIVLLFLDKKV